MLYFDLTNLHGGWPLTWYSTICLFRAWNLLAENKSADESGVWSFDLGYMPLGFRIL